jgi:hypothetical protein
MTLAIANQPPEGTASLDIGTIACNGTIHTGYVDVLIAPGAPPESSFTFAITGSGGGGASCADHAIVDVLRLALGETPGGYLPVNSNVIQFVAEIRPPLQNDRIRFELADVSSFPGDAMNHGSQLATDPDFLFESSWNPGFIVSPNGLVATTIDPVVSAMVTVSAFDYGARGTIRAVLEVLGCDSEVRAIPLDTDDDWLPDAYESALSSFDSTVVDTDSDGTPDREEDDDANRPVVADAGPNSHPGAQTSQGLTGDGLISFEEYRGFFAMGGHHRLSAQDKDIFAGEDTLPPMSPISVGLGYFSNLAGFVVHRIDPTLGEWDGRATRVVNFQRPSGLGITDQRALRVINSILGFFGIAHPLGAMANQSPNEMDRIEIDVAYHYSGLTGHLAGADGIYYTVDDTLRLITTTEADEALRETIGHECGHGVHIEHHFLLGDEHVFPEGFGRPNSIGVTSGGNGICESGAVGDDVQILLIGQGLADSVVIDGGLDGLDAGTLIMGDDAIVGDQVLSGGNGIAQTAATGNDIQVIAIGNAQPGTACVNTGADGICNTVATVDDTQSIALGRGEAFAVGISAGPDGLLQTTPFADDTVLGTTITTGLDGILNTYADAPTSGGIPTIMTSNLVVPIPALFGAVDLDQVRFHLKHP